MQWTAEAESLRQVANSADEVAVCGGRAPECPFTTVDVFAVGPGGRVLVVEARKGVMHALDSTRGWRTLGRRGSGPGEFVAPVAATFDDAGRLYVYDIVLSRLTEFDKELSVIRLSEQREYIAHTGWPLHSVTAAQLEEEQARRLATVSGGRSGGRMGAAMQSAMQRAMTPPPELVPSHHPAVTAAVAVGDGTFFVRGAVVPGAPTHRWANVDGRGEQRGVADLPSNESILGGAENRVLVLRVSEGSGIALAWRAIRTP